MSTTDPWKRMSWIKLRSELREDRRVHAFMRALGRSKAEIVGALALIWMAVDEQTEDGTLEGGTLDWIDSVAGVDGLASQLVDAGWLHVDGDVLTVPHFDEHMGDSAKARAQKSERQRRWRAKKGDSAVDAPPSTRGEERREELKTPLPPTGGSTRKASRKKVSKKVSKLKAAKPPPDPAQLEWRRWWEAEWLKVRGVKFHWSPKDAGQVPRILGLAEGDLEEAKRRGLAMLQSMDAFMAKKASPAWLVHSWNELSEKPSPAAGASNGRPDPADERRKLERDLGIAADPNCPDCAGIGLRGAKKGDSVPVDLEYAKPYHADDVRSYYACPCTRRAVSPSEATEPTEALPPVPPPPPPARAQGAPQGGR